MHLMGRHVLLTLALFLLMSSYSYAKRYSINGIFTIEVSDIFELQSNPSVKKTTIGDLTEVRGNRIVFQQLGLNERFQWAFDTYARIIIITGSGEDEGTFPACNQGVELTESEQAELIASARKDAMPWRITHGPSLSFNTEINGHPCLKLFYEREGGHGGARVTSYIFYNDTQDARIVTSYAIPDESIYKGPLSHSIESFSWNNPRFATGSSTMSDEAAEPLEKSNNRGLGWLIFLGIVFVFAMLVSIKSLRKMESEPRAETGNVRKTLTETKEIKLPPPLPVRSKKADVVKPEPKEQTEAAVQEVEKPIPSEPKPVNQKEEAVQKDIEPIPSKPEPKEQTEASVQEVEKPIPSEPKPVKQKEETAQKDVDPISSKPEPNVKQEAAIHEVEKQIASESDPEEKIEALSRRVNYSVASSMDLNEYVFYTSPDKGTIVYPHRRHKGKIRGYSEEMFERLIRDSFNNSGLEVLGDVNLKLSETARSYEPDIALVANNENNIRIDIEIDEPYSLVSRIPIHYTEDNSDAVRDAILKSAGWIVIRFAEEQIVEQPMACISSIARLLIQIDPSLVPDTCPISEYPNPVNRWTKAEAELMAKDNYREEYLEISGPVSPQEHGEEDTRPLTKEEKQARLEIKTIGLLGDTEKRTISRFNAENYSERDSRIEFFPESHTYILDGIINLLPATTVISNHFPAFDGPRIAERMVRNGYPKTVQELLDDFSYKGAIAREVGTFMHEQIENRFLGKESSDRYHFLFDSKTRTADEYVSIEQELSQFESFLNGRKIDPYRTEWRIFDEKYGIAGTIDLLAKSGDKYVMYDWKRSLKVVSPLSDGMYSIQGNGFDSGLGELSHLENSSYNHYCLQQNLYRRILKLRYGIDVAQMFLVVFHRRYDQYYLIPVPQMDQEINVILDEMEN